MGAPKYQELETGRITSGGIYNSGSNIVAEGANLPGIIYAETGTFLVARLRADGEWGNGILLKGPSLLGFGTNKRAILNSYFIWSLEPCEPQVIDPRLLNSTTESKTRDLIQLAHENDKRHIAALAEILSKRFLLEKVQGVFNLLTSNGAHPSPPITQSRIALVAGATRQRTNEAIIKLEEGGLERGESEDVYSLKEESPHSTTSPDDTSIEKLTMIVCARQARSTDEKLAHYLDFYRKEIEKPEKLTQGQLANLLCAGRPRLSETINRWITNGLLLSSGRNLTLTAQGSTVTEQITQGINHKEIRSLIS